MATATPSGSIAARPRASAVAWWNAFFFMLLCASEIGFMAGALDWGLAGVLHLGRALVIPLSVVLAIGVIWASYRAFRLALAAERRLSGQD